MSETQLVPDTTCNDVIFRHVLPKHPESPFSRWTLGVFSVGLERPIKSFNIGTTVEVGLSHNARINGKSVQSDVHLRVGSIEEGLFNLGSEGRGADRGEWDVVDERDLFARNLSRGEDIGSTSKGTRGNCDIRVNDPEDIVLGFTVRAYEIVDLGVHSHNLLTYSARQSTTPAEWWNA